MTLECRAWLASHGQQYSVEFEIENRGYAPVHWHRSEPFVDFRIIATGQDGAVEIEEPALDTVVQPTIVRIEPGEMQRWGTPIRVEFEPSARAPAARDLWVWRVRARLGEVALQVEFEAADHVLSCPLETGSPIAPLIKGRDHAIARRSDPREARSELESILSGQPSEEAWLALYRLARSWPEDELGPFPVQTAEVRLQHWPVEVRQLYGGFIHRDDGRPGPIGQLARTVRISRQTDSAEVALWRVATAPEFARLERLVVDRSEIFEGSLASLFGSTELRSLRVLELRGISFTRAMAEVFARGPLAAQLHELVARSCELTDAKLEIMFGHDNLSSLMRLDLSHNDLSPAGKEWIRARWRGPPNGLIL